MLYIYTMYYISICILHIVHTHMYMHIQYMYILCTIYKYTYMCVHKYMCKYMYM